MSSLGSLKRALKVVVKLVEVCFFKMGPRVGRQAQVMPPAVSMEDQSTVFNASSVGRS